MYNSKWVHVLSPSALQPREHKIKTKGTRESRNNKIGKGKEGLVGLKDFWYIVGWVNDRYNVVKGENSNDVSIRQKKLYKAH